MAARMAGIGQPGRIYSSQCCVIDDSPQYLRCVAGPGMPHMVQECYRTLAEECLRRQGKRILVIGAGGGDSAVHLAGRDAMKAIAVAGVPPGFRLAVVAATPDLVDIYDSAIVEASICGMQARRFDTEEEADAWLRAP
jgi:hypothetical protein